MMTEMCPPNKFSEEDKTTGSSPNSLTRIFYKRGLRMFMLAALGCQAVTLGLSSPPRVGTEIVESQRHGIEGQEVLSSFLMPQRSNMRYPEYDNTSVAEEKVVEIQLHGNEDQGVLDSFVMPERSNIRYPEYDNMTAAEKVASEYVVRNITDYDPLANCSVTSQVRILQESSQWIIQSIDANGNNKTVGGDEFYVTYTDNDSPQKGKHTAAALIQDLENGLYALTFKATPMNPNPGNLTGVGTLTVHFLYSCNIGLSHQPVKDKWQAGGSTLIHHTKLHVTQPPIQTFRPPSGVDLSTFDSIVSFGDSMMETFVRSKTETRAYHRGNNTAWFLNPNMDLSTESFPRTLRLLTKWHKNQHLIDRTNVAILLGSSAWDLMRPMKPRLDFRDHLRTCQRLVQKVRKRYPNVTVIWKAPAAMHIQEHTNCMKIPSCRMKPYYASNSRIKYLREEQMKVMKKLNVPVFDVFEATYLSGDQLTPGDSLHYEVPFNKLLLSYFYKDENRTQYTSTPISND